MRFVPYPCTGNLGRMGGIDRGFPVACEPWEGLI